MHGPAQAADVKQVTIRAVMRCLMYGAYLTQRAGMHGQLQAADVTQVNLSCQ